MRIFARLFGKEKKKKCFFCGEMLLPSDEPIGPPGVMFSNTNPKKQLEAVGKILKKPFMVCNNCGSVVCYSCAKASRSHGIIDWSNYPDCPKCRSENTKTLVF